MAAATVREDKLRSYFDTCPKALRPIITSLNGKTHGYGHFLNRLLNVP